MSSPIPARGDAAYSTRFIAGLRADRPIYAALAAYALISFGLSLALRDHGKFVPLVYVALWLRTAALGLAAFAIFCVAVAAGAGRLEQLKAVVRRLCTPQRIAGFCMLVALLVFHGVFTSTKTMLSDLAPFRYDRLLADLDLRLYGVDPWRLLTWLDPVTPLLQVIYAVAWTTALIAAMAFGCIEAKGLARRQFLWSFILCWVLLGNVLAGVVMSAGPVFYEGLLGDPRFHALTWHLDHHGIGGVLDCRAMLWRAYVERVGGAGTGISAFPSLHVSMATLFVLLASTQSRRLAWAAAAFGAVIFLSSIHLGWHYAVDGWASIAATLAIWWGVGLGVAARTRRVALQAAPA